MKVLQLFFEKMHLRVGVVLAAILWMTTLNLVFLAMWWEAAFRDWLVEIAFNNAGEAGFEGVLFHAALVIPVWVTYKLLKHVG